MEIWKLANGKEVKKFGEAQKRRTKDKESYINFGKVSNFAKV